MKKQLLVVLALIVPFIASVSRSVSAATYTGCSNWRTVTNPWTGLAITPGSDQRYANLNTMDLSCVDLNGVDFYGAVIGGVNWTNSNLTNTNFGGTSYCGGTFTGADIAGSNIQSTGTWSCASSRDVYVAPTTSIVTTIASSTTTFTPTTSNSSSSIASTTSVSPTTTTTSPTTTVTPTTSMSPTTTSISPTTTSISPTTTSISPTTTVPRIALPSSSATTIAPKTCAPLADQLYIYNYVYSGEVTNHSGRFDAGIWGWSFDYLRNCVVAPLTQLLIEDISGVRSQSNRSFQFSYDMKVSNCWRVARVSRFGQSEWSNRVCYTAPVAKVAVAQNTAKIRVPRGARGAQCFDGYRTSVKTAKACLTHFGVDFWLFKPFKVGYSNSYSPNVPSVSIGSGSGKCRGICYGVPSTVNGMPRNTYVKGYWRKDGTYVRPYTRSNP